MLYLFNSAYRNTYATNVLNTLSLPEGAINEYQYSKTRGHYNYIDESAFPKECSPNDDVIILFIDRASPNNFEFYPLRRGKFVCCEERDGRVYYYVKLGDFYSCLDIIQYNYDLKKALNGLLFNCDSDNDDGNKIGYFAFKSDHDALLGLKADDLSWSKVVESIANCKYIDEKYLCIFTRFHLYIGDGKTPLKVKTNGKDWYYNLKFKHKYIIKVEYCIPAMDRNPQDIYIDSELKCSIPSCQNVDFARRLGARASTLTYELLATAITGSAELYQETINKNLEIHNQHTGSVEKKVLQIAERRIRLVCRRSIARWIVIAFCLIGLLLSNLIFGLDTKGIIEAGNSQLMQNISLIGYVKIMYSFSLWLDKTNFIYISSTFASVGSTIFTMLLVYLYGKKEL